MAVIDSLGDALEILEGVVEVDEERVAFDCTGRVPWTNWSCEASGIRLELGTQPSSESRVYAELYGDSWTLVTLDLQRPTWAPHCTGGEGCPPACVWGELVLEAGVSWG